MINYVYINKTLIKLLEIKDPKIGLSFKKEIPNNSGFLMFFPTYDATVSMTSMKIPLDIITIDKNKITDILGAYPGDVLDLYAKQVLEVPFGFCTKHNIKINDTVTFLNLEIEKIKHFENSIKNEKNIRKNHENKLLIFDKGGSVQYTLEGNALVFSRPDTKKILELGKKRDNKKNILNLGESIVKFRNIQIERERNNEEEYTTFN
jgi:uncharacterized membrane protein (UPF0127 family)